MRNKTIGLVYWLWGAICSSFFVYLHIKKYTRRLESTLLEIFDFQPVSLSHQQFKDNKKFWTDNGKT